MRIYADNASTTKMSRAAIDAMLPYLAEQFGNPSSPYALGQAAKNALETAREDIAAVLGAAPREIYFTSGGTEADNQALRSAAAQGKRAGKTHIVSTAFEHHAVLRTLEALRSEGFAVTLLPVDETGLVEPEALASAIREDTCLVSVMAANNEIGTLQPVDELADICRRRGVVFHTDAVQAVGHVELDMRALGADMLSASAHKFHGPKGAGFLYVRKGRMPESLLLGGAQERGRRAGTENVAGAVAMAAALRECAEHREADSRRLTALRDRLTEGLSSIPHGILNGDAQRRLPGNVNFSFEGVEGEALLLLLDEKGISASAGSACAAGSLQPSHVLLALGRAPELARGALRLTLGEDATAQEIDYMIRAVRDAVETLRAHSPAWQERMSGRAAFLL